MLVAFSELFTRWTRHILLICDEFTVQFVEPVNSTHATCVEFTVQLSGSKFLLAETSVLITRWSSVNCDEFQQGDFGVWRDHRTTRSLSAHQPLKAYGIEKKEFKRNVDARCNLSKPMWCLCVNFSVFVYEIWAQTCTIRCWKCQWGTSVTATYKGLTACLLQRILLVNPISVSYQYTCSYAYI